jgi:hypothetical protein
MDAIRIVDVATDALSTFRIRGSALRRASLLCDLADALSLSRPRQWRDRARRAYQDAVRRLRAPPAGEAAISQGSATDGDAATADLAALAHGLLREARRPYRRLSRAAAQLAVLAATGLVGLTLLVAVVSRPARDWLFPPDLAAQATWTASSAVPGVPSSGRSPSSDGTLFFHTTAQDHPWVRIDLPRQARVREIRIKNRTDCCAERALPLNIEVPDGDGWRLICQRRAPFSTWSCHPPPTWTRILRITIPGMTYLHLKSVAVYE